MISLDDTKLIMGLNNPGNNKKFSIRNIFFKKSINHYYRPLLELSFIADSKVWLMEASGYHLTNYILHALNVLLFFSIVTQLFKDYSHPDYLPFMCVMLFAVHPLCCESVAWISGRSDLLAAFFCFLAFRFYISGISVIKGRQILVMLCVLSGMLSKESALSIIPIILIANFALKYRKNTDLKHSLKSTSGWATILLVPLIVYLWLRMPVMTHLDHGIKKAVTSSLSTYNGCWNWNLPFFYIPSTLSFYIKKLFFPFPLNFAIYKINIPLYFFMFLLILILNLWFIIKKHYLLVCWTCLIISAFAPAVFVAFSKLAWTPFAERYLYLTIPVWALAVVSFILHIPSTSPSKVHIFLNVIFFILILFSISSFNRNLIWHDNLSLWKDTYKKSPDFGKVLYKYGAALGGVKGLPYFKKAVKVSRDDEWKDFSLIALAQQAFKDKRYKASAAYADKAIQINPIIDNYLLAANIIEKICHASHYKSVSNLKKLTLYYDKIYNINHNPRILFRMGQLYSETGDLKKSRHCIDQLISTFPHSRYNLKIIESDSSIK